MSILINDQITVVLIPTTKLDQAQISTDPCPVEVREALARCLTEATTERVAQNSAMLNVNTD